MKQNVMQRPITFVVAVREKGAILKSNFLASPCFQQAHTNLILIPEDFRSAARAYNNAMDQSPNDLMVFAHQDVIFPAEWQAELERALEELAISDPHWGVLGCGGATEGNERPGYVYSSGCGIIGRAFQSPVPVQTLDELVLILRKSSGLRFDETLPHFHLYGTDICMRAQQMGRKNYAISAFCIHNTHQNLILAREFYECYWHVRRRWKNRLPIQTTCIRMTRFNLPLYRRWLEEARLRYIQRKEFGGTRRADVERLLTEVNAMVHAA